MLGALALACAWQIGSFPSDPIKTEFDRGFALARKQRGFELRDLLKTPNPRRSIQSVFKDDRKYVGWWSNGYEQVPVEEVVWLSPALMSRWIGFLAAQEYLSDEEITRRWGIVSDAMGSRRAFVVQLSSFPKQSTYGVGEAARNDPGDLDHVRFVYTSGAEVKEMKSFQIARWQARTRANIDEFHWWQWLPIAEAVRGEFDLYSGHEPLPLGDYHRTWSLVWVEDADDPVFEVRILSRRKERVAHFRH